MCNFIVFAQVSGNSTERRLLKAAVSPLELCPSGAMEKMEATILENQMEKKMDNEMETGIIYQDPGPSYLHTV